MEKILFNVPPAEKQRWQEAAKREGLSLSEWLRQAARDRVGGVEEPATLFVSPAAEVPYVKETTVKLALSRDMATGSSLSPKRPRTKSCEHRVPAGTYCKRCD